LLRSVSFQCQGVDAFASERVPEGPVDHLVLIHQTFAFEKRRNNPHLEVIPATRQILDLNRGGGKRLLKS